MTGAKHLPELVRYEGIDVVSIAGFFSLCSFVM